MSEAENPELLLPEHEVSAEDIRVLVGPTTPHFALQVRNRIRRLIAPLPDEHPAKIEGVRQIARLERLAASSGEPRSTFAR